MGGAGFIGSAVMRHIIANTQDSVVNLDKLTYAGNLESLSQVSSDQRYYFEQVDICDRNEVERVVAEHKPDAVMHLAAESHVDRSIDEMYGDLEGADELFTESTSYAPSSPYSASKASSDHLVRAWRKTYGLPALITSCSNNFGP